MSLQELLAKATKAREWQRNQLQRANLLPSTTVSCEDLSFLAKAYATITNEYLEQLQNPDAKTVSISNQVSQENETQET